MKLSVSNLAFPATFRLEAYAKLALWNVSGIELAPTRLAEWHALTPDLCKAEARILDDFGLQASSLQAVFFDRPELQLLGDAASFAALVDHLRRVADLGFALGAGVAVFGAPRNRIRGAMPEPQAEDLATDRLYQIGEALAKTELILGMEPVPQYYGGDFLTTAEAVTAMVRRVDHPRIRLHLDTGCVALGGGDIVEAIWRGADVMMHFHAAEPDLASFEAPALAYVAAGVALSSIGYNKWVVIEMKEPKTDVLAGIKTAVTFVQSSMLCAPRARAGSPHSTR